METLKPRVEQLKNAAEPFGTPSDASKKKVDSGTVTLPDGVVIRVEDADKEFIHALSSRFGIDQVHALVLLRFFFYNEGLPADVGAGSDGSAPAIIQELVKAITPFYYSERLYVLRTLIPFFRSLQSPGNPILEIAEAIIPKIITDAAAFVDTRLGVLEEDVYGGAGGREKRTRSRRRHGRSRMRKSSW